MIWRPELLLKESLAELTINCRRGVPATPVFLCFAGFSLRSAVTKRLLPCGKLLPKTITGFETQAHFSPGWSFGEAQPCFSG
jgi:hypothetical protein